MGIVPLSKYRVSVLPCHFDRALPLVISTERKRAEKSAGRLLRQTGAREVPFCALRWWLRCARGRYRPVVHRDRPARPTRRVPMCGSLAGAGTMVGEFGEGG